jgi:hypothetical protein
MKPISLPIGRFILAVIAMLIAITGLTGCAYVSAVALLLTPEEKIPAEYKIPEKMKVAVFVDDYMSPLGNRELKKSLATSVGQQLIAAKVIQPEDLIDPEKVLAAPTETPDGKKFSIQHIGRDLHADYVIYINIIDFNLQSDPDNPLIQPKSRAYVKVIEVATGERLWPIDVAGYPIQGKEHMQGELTEEADKNEWSQKLVDKLATSAAELFYAHSK